MCLQDLRIARHIKTRVISPVRVVGTVVMFKPSPDRFGLCILDDTTGYFCVLSDAGLPVPVPSYRASFTGFPTSLYTDLTMFPGLGSVEVGVHRNAPALDFLATEQYYDSDLSKLVQGDV